MKKTLIPLILLFSGQALSFEWEGAVREEFITPHSYHYNSDSMARIIRDLNDRGYMRIAAHPRLTYTGDAYSLVSQSRYKSSYDDLSYLNSRVTLLDAELTLKPLFFEHSDLGEARPLTGIAPLRPLVLITSYEQQMAAFAKISRQKNIGKLVVGSGLGTLLKERQSAKRIEEMLLKLRKTTSPKTELVFELVGDQDLDALRIAVGQGFNPTSSINGVSLVLDLDRHYENGFLKLSEVEKTLKALETLLPGTPIHLSRITVPSCLDFSNVGHEFYCVSKIRNNELQMNRLLDLKKKVLKLEEKGFVIKSVEVMESSTDFEPVISDPRYPYYNPLLSNPDHLALPQKKTVLAAIYPVSKNQGERQACIYYDKLDAPPLIDRMGDIHSIMLESNLGAFKSWKVKRKALGQYVPGEISECDSLFYFATNFMQEPDVSFLDEVSEASFTIPVVWFNYKFNNLVDSLQRYNIHPGFEVPYVLQPDTTPSATNLDPGFFRFFDYKGETFLKLTEWNHASNNFAASPEINGINIINKKQVEVLSMARHSYSNKEIPYVVKSGNIYYFADSPMSFTHYEDRYFILADLLWDIMDEQPPTERIALARFEDIAPNTDVDYLRWAIDYMHSVKAPFSLAVIPSFVDLIGDSGAEGVVHEPITEYPRHVQAIRYATKRGGSIIMHGVSHALGNVISGYDGLTGSDYEFWLYPENVPLPFDSVDWLTKRLERGIDIFNKMGLTPAAFEIPHYAASVMNYMVLGKMFRWQYHRTVYFPYEIITDTGLPPNLEAFNCKPSTCGDERRAILNNIKVDADYHSFGGVPVPYIIYKDPYGQRVIPETLGMIDFAFYGPKTWRPVSKPEDIIRRAKKLKVIRGAIPSFFWHPQLLDKNFRYYKEVPGSFETIGGKNSLRLVVEGIQELGFTFKSIEDKQFFPDEVY